MEFPVAVALASPFACRIYVGVAGPCLSNLAYISHAV
jgi:hypothetical protein